MWFLLLSLLACTYSQEVDNCDGKRMTIELHTGEYAAEYEWSVSHGPGCFMPSNMQYEDNSVYTYDCCAQLGETTVTCVDSWGDGWQGGYLVVDGVEYCKGFPESISETALLIPGTYAPTSATTTTTTTTQAVVMSHTGCQCMKEWSLRGGGGTDNYCANLDEDPNGPWCFTEPGCEQEWDYCDIPSFPTNDPTPEPTELFIPIGGLSTTTTPSCSSRESLLRVTLQTAEAYPDEISWFLTDDCQSGETAYESNLQYVHFCCLEDNVYTLTCMDSWSDGWHGGHISIGDEYYCDSEFGATESVDIAVGSAVLPEDPDSFEPTGFTSFTCEDPASARLCMSAEISGEPVDPTCEGFNENGYIAETDCDEECIFNKCVSNEECGGYLRIGGGFVMSPLDIAVGQTYSCEVKSPPCGMEEVSVIFSAQSGASRFAWSIDESCAKASAYLDGEMYVRSCCLEAGFYELECATDGSLGYVQINGQNYCNNAADERASLTFGNPVSTDAPTTTQPVDCVYYEVTVNPDDYPEEMAFNVDGIEGCAVNFGDFANMEESTSLGECCFPSGSVVTLTCADEYGDGWSYGGKQGSITIGDVTYCEGFSDGYYSEPIEIQVVESSDAPSTTMPESSDAPSTTMPESSDAPSTTMPDSSEAPSTTMPESSDIPEDPCEGVMCTMVVCPDGSNPPVPEGECCGDMSLCPTPEESSTTMPETSTTTMPEESSTTMPETSTTTSEGECVDFANSAEAAMAMGDQGCLVQYDGWTAQEFCGQYELATCDDPMWGQAYSECCPQFCGLCGDEETSMDEGHCDMCAHTFAENGGCECWASPACDVSQLVSEGCDMCENAAAQLCYELMDESMEDNCPSGTFDIERTCMELGEWCDDPDGVNGCLSCELCQIHERAEKCPECEGETTEAALEDCVDFDIMTHPDGYPEEMSWGLVGFNRCGLLQGELTINDGVLTTTCCVPTGTQITIRCGDGYGDGWGYEGVQGYLSIDGQTYCDNFNSGYSVESYWIVEAPPTEAPQTTEDVCVDNAEFSNNRDFTCGDIGERLSSLQKKCENMGLLENCCQTCADLETRTTEEIEFVDLICPGGYTLDPTATFVDDELTGGFPVACGDANGLCNLQECDVEEARSIFVNTDCCREDRPPSVSPTMTEIIPECVDVLVTLFPDGYPEEMHWVVLGTECYLESGYDYAPMDTVCCLPDGEEMTIECNDMYGDGWGDGNQGYILINGETYCDTFTANYTAYDTFIVAESDLSSTSTSTTSPDVEESMDSSSDSEDESMGDAVCEGVQLEILTVVDNYPQEMGWSILESEECEIPLQSLAGIQGMLPMTCCLPEMDTYTLLCADTYGDGWGHGDVQGYLWINDMPYCHEFTTGYEVQVSVSMSGEVEESMEETTTTTTLTPTMEMTTTPEPDFTCDDGIVVDVITMVDNYPGEMSWAFAEAPACNQAEGSLQPIQAPQYTSCCLPEGTPLTLMCQDSYGDGWTVGYIEINGVRYCSDYSSGYEIRETVTIGRAVQSTTEPAERQLGETCGYVFPIGDVGTCAEGLECACVGMCADPNIADYPSTCMEPSTSQEPTTTTTTSEPTEMQTTEETTTTTTTSEPTEMPTPEPTAAEYLAPEEGMLDSMARLLERSYTEDRLISVAQRASNLLQEKNENGDKLAPYYDPIVQDALRKMRRFWKNGQTDESYWSKVKNQYNNIAEVLGRETL